MADDADHVTRVAVDLTKSTVADGARGSRSSEPQFDHRVPVAAEVSGQPAPARRQVEAALAGELNLGELSAEDGAVFNAEITAAIRRKLANSNYGKLFAEAGLITVALDEKGDMVEYRPDGSSVVLTGSRPTSPKGGGTPRR